MKHALFVAFHYPPEASSSGVLRTLKYTRYMPEFGWRATVLTLRRDAYDVTDATLEQQIPAAVRVVRTNYLNTKRHLSAWGRYPAILAVPDRWIGWSPWAIRAGRRILHEDPVNVIYSTSPHASAHIIASHLARHSKLPLVVDFRDPWYELPPEPGTPHIIQWFAPRLESKVVRQAKAVITSTKELQDTLLERYAHEDININWIPNGYDEADFAVQTVANTGKTDRFTIVHAGSINSEFRDPRPLFDAIRHLGNRGYINLARIRIRFLGAGNFGESREVLQHLQQTHLTSIVEFVPRLPYKKALAELGAADVLLLMQASHDTIGLVPAKLYEYLRIGKPVLALVYPGAASDVIEDTNGGWTVDPRHNEDLQQAVRQTYESWLQGRLTEKAANLKTIRKFSRKQLTERLVQIFDTVSA